MIVLKINFYVDILVACTTNHVRMSSYVYYTHISTVDHDSNNMYLELLCSLYETLSSLHFGSCEEVGQCDKFLASHYQSKHKLICTYHMVILAVEGPPGACHMRSTDVLSFRLVCVADDWNNYTIKIP